MDAVKTPNIGWWPRPPTGGLRTVLGVNPGPHDAAAALIVDGKLIAMEEEERLTRVKNAHGLLPLKAVEEVLRRANLKLQDVDLIAAGWAHPLVGIDGSWPGHSLPTAAAASVLVDALASSDGSYLRLTESLHRNTGVGVGGPETLRDAPLPPVAFVPHHEAHAWTALLASKRPPKIVLVLDGRGEEEATSVYRVHESATRTELRLVERWPIRASLGNFYMICSEWCGLGMWGAGKLMGLAAYGVRSKAERSSLPLTVSDNDDKDGVDQFFEQRDALYGSWAEEFPYEPNFGHGYILDYASLASRAQLTLEHEVLSLVARHADPGDSVAFAGGVGENSVLVGKMSEIYRVAVPFAPHDAGVGLGAALAAAAFLNVELDAPQNPYVARSWSHKEIREALEATRSPMRIRHVPNIGKRVEAAAAKLAQGEILGWFSGCGEIGRRALGARSILADPRSRAMMTRVNRVKGREAWRPLAPAVLEEHFTTVIQHDEVPETCAAMLSTWKIREHWRPKVPAVVHIDGTARAQSIGIDAPLEFRGLVEAFYQLTGIPAIMNTSFNGAGDPIVWSPADALETSIRIGLDALVLGEHIIDLE